MTLHTKEHQKNPFAFKNIENVSPKKISYLTNTPKNAEKNQGSYLNNNVLKKQNCSKKSEKSAQTLCKWVLYLNTPSWQYLKVPLKKVFSAMLNVTCFPDEKSKYQTDNYNCMVVTVVL